MMETQKPEHQEVGAMLLPGTPLLPNNAVPLHIFEPRYRFMLADAMSGERKFAIARLTQEEGEELGECVDDVGILVKVVVHQELADGRSMLIVKGESPIRFLRWTGSLPYPMAEYEVLDREPLDDESSVELLLRDDATLDKPLAEHLEALSHNRRLTFPLLRYQTGVSVSMKIVLVSTDITGLTE